MNKTQLIGNVPRFIVLKLLASLMASLLMHGAIANVEPKEPTRAEKRLAAFHETFELTGDSDNCINTRRIRNTSIIDKNHILFRLSHGEYVLNTLPRTCHSLRRGKAFAYAPISQQLCSVDTITVLDDNHSRNFRLIGPRCGLGRFSTVKKKSDLMSPPRID